MKEEFINEAILKSTVAIFILNRLDASKIASGIMNMYDYIVDEDDINLFLRDYPAKERILWSSLYKLYQNKVWSTIDVDKTVIDELRISGKTKVTPEFRRDLRKYIKQSRNSKLDIQASAPEFLTSIYDSVNDTYYILTLNRSSSYVTAALQVADKKLISAMFDKISGFQTESADDIDESILKSIPVDDIKHLINVCYKWVLNHKGLALDVVEQIITLCLLFKDNKVSTKDKLLILAALIYLISPADLIPDVTISGLADDAAVVLAVIETLKIYITPELKAKAKAKMEELFKKKDVQEMVSFRSHLLEALNK